MGSINFIFEHGKGCSGKDTQAHLIHEHFGEKAVELSTGDIFRGAITGQGEYGRFKAVLDPYVEEVNKRGGYISDVPIVEIVQTIVLEQIEKGIETFIFTGFPRTTVQLDLVDNMLAELQATGTHVLLDVSDDTVRERARVRRESDVQNGKNQEKMINPNKLS